MFRVIIDGEPHEFPEQSSLLDALQSSGHDVPHLCHDPRLKPYGGCRLCMVEIDGEPRPVPACSTGLADGMVIRSQSDALYRLRRTQLILMAAHYPLRAVVLEPDLPFHRYLMEYGLHPPADEVRRPFATFCDHSHPYIDVDMSRCISCYRCVRICDEVQGELAWRIWNRGEQTRILPDGPTLRESSCVSCGACVDTCPSGALSDRMDTLHAPGRLNPLRWTRTTCVYCGTGCEMLAGVRDGQLITMRPALDAAVNRGHLCVKGRYAWGYVNAADRVTTPLLRAPDGRWLEVGWEEAYDFIAARLKAIRTEHGADSIGVLGSARATNEENYLAQKFARQVIGTNNVDCCARVCHAPSAAALKAMLGTGAATNHFDDIEKAALILVAGANPRENHPIIGARILQAVKRGAKLIVIDPRAIDLTESADIHLALRPGSNVLLFNAMSATIIEEGLFDRKFVDARVAGFEKFCAFISDYAPEKVAGRCAVSAPDIRAAARLYARHAPAMSVHGLGITEHEQGTDGVMALINLALLSGNLGKPGAGINPLRGQNNVQGAAHMGCEPRHLTGYLPLHENSERFARVWGAPLPESPGLDLMQMMDAARAGRFKGLWVFGFDVCLTLADMHNTRAGLARMELVVVQDIFLNETAKAFGHVFLPAATHLEKEGTFMNADRRVQRVRQVIPPRGASRPDWEIFCDMARKMGEGDAFDFNNAEEIWDEVRSVWTAGKGLSYARLEQENLHWPCPDEQHPGTPVLHETRFPIGERATLACVKADEPSETVDGDYPLMLVTGRHLQHFNAGTMTYRTPNVVLASTDVLEISPADAAQLGLVDGSSVRVISRQGEVTLPLRLSDRVKRGELFTTFHRPDLAINRLTTPCRDGPTGAPAYKCTAVRLVAEN
jgi:formate dehydrogenase major subunit